MGIVDGIKDMFNMVGSKRRSHLGVGVALWDSSQSRYYRNLIASLFAEKKMPDKLSSDFQDDFGKISWRERHVLLRNAKKALAMRTYEDLPERIRFKVDQRRDWNKQNRPTTNILEQFFPSLQFSYSTPLPVAYRKGSVDLVVSEKSDGKGAKGYVADIARSHSIWLDPVDAPKELYKYKLRINRVIDWAYKQGYVPVMMTLTTFHRWHYLDELRIVLREAWKDFFSSYSGRKRVAAVDLQGWIRRLEITINDGDKIDFSTGEVLIDDGGSDFNSGWHPHFHAILIVPKDKLELLSSLEQEWRDAWVVCVQKQFKKVFGEEIDSSYLPAFRQHGLWFSRYSKDSYRGKKGDLRPVDTGDYLAKIMGYDSPEVYGGDSEMTASDAKNSKIPFDLIRDAKLPASNVDLWVEYAFATKGVPAFKFSVGLEDKVNDYFKNHPDKAKSSDNGNFASSVIGSLDNDIYRLLCRNFLLDDLKKKIAEGYDALCSWLKATFVELGVPELCDCPFAFPRPPT